MKKNNCSYSNSKNQVNNITNNNKIIEKTDIKATNLIETNEDNFLNNNKLITRNDIKLANTLDITINCEKNTEVENIEKDSTKVASSAKSSLVSHNK